MNFLWLNWRLSPGWLHTRAFLCDDCWRKFAPHIKDPDDDSGHFILITTQATETHHYRLHFSSKGYDCYDGPCELCNANLPGGGEEVYFSIPIQHRRTD